MRNWWSIAGWKAGKVYYDLLSWDACLYNVEQDVTLDVIMNNSSCSTDATDFGRQQTASWCCLCVIPRHPCGNSAPVGVKIDRYSCRHQIGLLLMHTQLSASTYLQELKGCFFQWRTNWLGGNVAATVCLQLASGYCCQTAASNNNNKCNDQNNRNFFEYWQQPLRRWCRMMVNDGAVITRN